MPLSEPETKAARNKQKRVFYSMECPRMTLKRHVFLAVRVAAHLVILFKKNDD